jgi:endonuclease-3
MPRRLRKADAAFAARILDALERAHPEARCALDHRNPFELSVATILSAQCTDERVNMVTPQLFARYPDAETLAEADASELEAIIRSTGFFRSKARSLMGFARGLRERHGGQVPRTMAELVPLPGIGRKTANVVLGHAYGVEEGIAVDTHVLRVSNRIGLAASDDPLEIERQLMAIVPRERWTRTTDLLIFHGRKICAARRPACGVCPVFADCGFEGKLAYAHTAAPASRAETARARSASRAKPVAPASAARRVVRKVKQSRFRPRGGNK